MSAKEENYPFSEHYQMSYYKNDYNNLKTVVIPKNQESVLQFIQDLFGDDDDMTILYLLDNGYLAIFHQSDVVNPDSDFEEVE